MKAKDYEFLDIDNPRIDFERIASGLGVESYRVETVKQMDSLLPQAIRTVPATGINGLDNGQIYWIKSIRCTPEGRQSINFSMKRMFL